MTILALLEPLSPQRHWRRFCLVLIGLYLARGVAALCVLPPDEGWDEYQHVAYLAFTDEQGRAPVFGQDFCPVPLLRALVALPHPDHAIDQLRDTGAQGYAAFFAATQPAEFNPAAPQIPLYQAQHPSLYYRLALPIFRAAGGIAKLSRTIVVLRLVNLLLAAAAIGLVLGCLPRLLGHVAGTRPPEKRIIATHSVAALAGLLIAMQPILLLNAVRVSNDALSILFATLAIRSWLLTPARPRRTLVAGMATGLAILSKTLHTALIPFGLTLIALELLRRRDRWRESLRDGAIFLACVAVCTGGYFAFNLRHFGTLTPMQEAVVNRDAGRGFGDLVRAGLTFDWVSFVRRLWLRHPIWAGGWSFVAVRRWFLSTHELTVLLALAGWLVLAIRRISTGTKSGSTGASPWLAILLLAFWYTAGLAFHILHCVLAHGLKVSNVWYLSAVIPWTLLLVVAGSAGWPSWLKPLLPLNLLGLYALVPCVGVPRMVATYSAVPNFAAGLGRLATLQPAALGTLTFWTAVGAAILLGGLAFAVSLPTLPPWLATDRWRSEEAESADISSGRTGARPR